MKSSIKVVSVALLLIPFSVFPASFDCVLASNKIERSICNDSKLSQLDVKMDELYRQVIGTSKVYLIDKNLIKSKQRAWLKNRSSSCTLLSNMNLKNCLENQYESRIVELNKQVRGAHKLKIGEKVVLLHKDKFSFHDISGQGNAREYTGIFFRREDIINAFGFDFFSDNKYYESYPYKHIFEIEKLSENETKDLQNTFDYSEEIIDKTTNTLSINVHTYTFAGGAHGYYTNQYLNYDIKKKSIISWPDIFEDNDAIDDRLLMLLKKKLKSNAESNTRDSLLSIKETGNFVITSNGLTLIYPEFSITACPEETITLSISHKELLGLMSKNKIQYYFNRDY